MNDIEIEYNTLIEAYKEVGKLPAKNVYYIYKNIKHKYCITRYKKYISSKPEFTIYKVDNFNDYNKLGKKLIRIEKIKKINKLSNND